MSFVRLLHFIRKTVTKIGTLLITHPLQKWPSAIVNLSVFIKLCWVGRDRMDGSLSVLISTNFRIIGLPLFQIKSFNYTRQDSCYSLCENDNVINRIKPQGCVRKTVKNTWNEKNLDVKFLRHSIRRTLIFFAVLCCI